MTRESGNRITLRLNPGFGHGHSRKTNTGGEQSKHGEECGGCLLMLIFNPARLLRRLILLVRLVNCGQKDRKSSVSRQKMAP
jgi:diaminopimelate decarboxylase